MGALRMNLDQSLSTTVIRGRLEYDYPVAPGADPKSIRLAVEGARKLRIDPSIVFVTYLGGSGTDEGLSLTITTASEVTLAAGSTSSANFPI